MHTLMSYFHLSNTPGDHWVITDTLPPQLSDTWQHVEGGNLGLKMVRAGAKAQLLLDRELA